MNYLQLKKEIRQGQIKPVTFMYGTQSFLMEDIIHDITRKSMSAEEAEVNITSFSLVETPLEIIIEEAETVPFFGGKKLVIVKDFHLVSSQKQDSKIEHELQTFERYIENPVPETVLILMAPYEKLDERKKITKLIKSHSVVVETNPFDEKMTEKWIDEQAQLKQFSFTIQGKQRLMERQGTNLLMLASEIEKLSLFAGEGGRIDETIVDELVARTLEQDVFELVNHAAKQNISKALTIYHDLLKQKEEPLKILALLTRQFRIYYQVKELSRRAYSQKQIASQLKLHPYVVKLAQGQVNRYEDRMLLSILSRAADTDYAIKRGAMDKVLAVELFLISFAKQQA
ncbi:DNA polymerase III subunit delta [Bacillus solitudinis]|uniref:DNA polymerase III subunit delta n=1 Tax=Bacillus solitudinis TaxID=2014074 RepID=UPI000C24647D|nr:DNA polymerase III subunit delta [Bacillus solitudinis]